MKSTIIIKNVVFSLLLATIGPVFAADDVKVIEARDLEAIGKQAQQKRLPILLMFSAGHCTYCNRLEEEFLKPMLRSGDYTDKVLIRKLKLDDQRKVRDFGGRQVAVSDIADRYKIFVTPTVVFIDGDGMELAQKRVGLTTPDFYGGYLDQSIDQALNILRRDSPMRVKLSVLERAE